MSPAGCTGEKLAVRGRVLSGGKGERDLRHRVCLEGACLLFVLLHGCMLYVIVMLIYNRPVHDVLLPVLLPRLERNIVVVLFVVLFTN